MPSRLSQGRRPHLEMPNLGWLCAGTQGGVRAAVPWASLALGPDPNPTMPILGLGKGPFAHFQNSFLPSA